MGRILKKKPEAKKKKKPTDGGDGAPVPAGDPGEALSTEQAGSKEPARPATPPVRKPMPAARPTPARGEPNFFEKAVQFLREVKVELKKVTWPTRKQTLGSTVVVIVLVMLVSLFLGLVDMGLSGIIRAVLQ